jgi:hypothetical protein
MAGTPACTTAFRACFITFTALYKELYTVNGLALCAYMRYTESYKWPYSVRLLLALVLGPQEYFTATP